VNSLNATRDYALEKCELIRRCTNTGCVIDAPAVRIAAMKTIVYGIKNCDTMKKARAWLDANGVSYAFHDYKVAGIDRATLERWAASVGWETLINRAGTTFRKLPEQQKTNLTQAKAIALMLEQPSMIKRPVLERGKTLLVGFSPEKYAALK
jgi:arsenate reductase